MEWMAHDEKIIFWDTSDKKPEVFLQVRLHPPYAASSLHGGSIWSRRAPACTDEKIISGLRMAEKI